MSILNNMTVASEAEEQEERVGGFRLIDSGIYDAKIKLAYLLKSDAGAIGVSFVFDVDGSDYRETIWISNRNGETFYYKKDDKGNYTDKKVQQPGYQRVNSICRLAIDKQLDEMQPEEKVLQIWNSEEKKEMPKSCEVLTELHGATVKLAILKVLENKSEKGDDGKYRDIAEDREINTIDGVMVAEGEYAGATVTELTKSKPIGVFMKSWDDANTGKVRDKRTIKDGAGAKSGRPQRSGASAPEASEKKATSSLFKK